MNTQSDWNRKVEPDRAEQARQTVMGIGQERVQMHMRDAMTVNMGSEVAREIPGLRQRVQVLQALDASECQAAFKRDLNLVLSTLSSRERSAPFVQLLQLRLRKNAWDTMRLCRMRFHGGCDRLPALRAVLKAHDKTWLESRLRSLEFAADAISSTPVRQPAAIRRAS